MKVTIDVTLDHKGNPRGSGKAEAILIFIDRQGKRYERKVTAAVENDTKNALALKIATAALKILIKPCDVEMHLDNEYVKNALKTVGWKNGGSGNGRKPPENHRQTWSCGKGYIYRCRFIT